MPSAKIPSAKTSHVAEPRVKQALQVYRERGMVYDPTAGDGVWIWNHDSVC